MAIECYRKEEANNRKQPIFIYIYFGE